MKKEGRRATDFGFAAVWERERGLLVRDCNGWLGKSRARKIGFSLENTKTKRGRGVCCVGEAGTSPPPQALKTAGAVCIEAKSQLYWELWLSKDGVEIRLFPAGLLRF